MKAILDGLVDWVTGPLGNVGIHAVRGKQKGPWIARNKAQAEKIISLIASGVRPKPGHDGVIARPVDEPRNAKPAPAQIIQMGIPWPHRGNSCACDSFKRLDMYYTDHPGIHDLWRKGARGSIMSPYDYFMSINLQRMNRGIKGMRFPPPGRHKMTWLRGEGVIPVPDTCFFNPLASVRAFQDEGQPEAWFLGLDLDLFDPVTRDTHPGFVWVWFRSTFNKKWGLLSGHRDAWFGVRLWFIGAWPADMVRFQWAPDGNPIDRIEFPLNKVIKGPMWGIMRR